MTLKTEQILEKVEKLTKENKLKEMEKLIQITLQKIDNLIEKKKLKESKEISFKLYSFLEENKNLDSEFKDLKIRH